VNETHQLPSEETSEPQKTAPVDPGIGKSVLSCPKCGEAEIEGPVVTWKWFQNSIAAVFMTLFVVHNSIEQAAERANAPTAEDLASASNPFIEHVPRVYVQPDYSPMYVIGVFGLCIAIAILIAAVRARITCTACGHSWRAGSRI
jgi:hypothetical protein